MRLMTPIWLLLCCTGVACAQTSPIILEGIVIDSLKNNGLLQATVLLIPVKDSAQTRLQLTDQQGRFAFTGVAPNQYRLRVSYVGYQTWVHPIRIAASNKLAQLTPIRLAIQTQRLTEVTVQRDIPILFKKDTIEYRADSFSAQPNALLEDLLKRLPGVEVNNDGSVSAQGQLVQQIFVDGKPFFGNDPKMATQNLPASLIKTIQVFEKRSDQATFSGVDDGKRAKTINIITKPEAKKGYSGSKSPE